MGIFDTHAHYDDGRFNQDREELLRALPDRGIEFVLNSGADLISSEKSIELAQKYDFIYAAVGVHPHDVGKLDEKDLDKIRNMTNNKKVVAIGEIGLDYHYDYSPREAQRIWFDKQLKLAYELNLPVIVHSREAAEETFDIIRSNHKKGMTGVIHAYSGSLDMAKEYVKLGFYIGIGGVLTFKNAKKLLEVVEGIELSHLILETDCPYMAPEPVRGSRNDSANLVHVVRKLSEIKGMAEEEVIKVTTENGMRLFKISKK